jgi:hypothetical protein
VILKEHPPDDDNGYINDMHAHIKKGFKQNMI